LRKILFSAPVTAHLGAANAFQTKQEKACSPTKCHDNPALQPGPTLAELEVKMKKSNEKIEQLLKVIRATTK